MESGGLCGERDAEQRAFSLSLSLSLSSAPPQHTRNTRTHDAAKERDRTVRALREGRREKETALPLSLYTRPKPAPPRGKHTPQGRGARRQRTHTRAHRQHTHKHTQGKSKPGGREGRVGEKRPLRPLPPTTFPSSHTSTKEKRNKTAVRRARTESPSPAPSGHVGTQSEGGEVAEGACFRRARTHAPNRTKSAKKIRAGGGPKKREQRTRTPGARGGREGRRARTPPSRQAF